MQKYKFSPGIFGTVITLIGVTLFCSLALWQFGRATEKEELQEMIEQRLAQPAFSYKGDILDLNEMKYRLVSAKGHFESTHQLLLDNIVFEGKPGYEAITPFRLENGSYVLVNRGWVPQGAYRDQLPDIDLQARPRTITGRIEQHKSRPVVGGDTPRTDASNRWRYVDTELFAEESGISTPGFIIRLDSQDPDAYRQQESRFDAKVGMHIGYAVQWAAFALFALGTWIGVSFRTRNGKPEKTRNELT
ncbi:SURF1 family protein [Solemya velum gill symbiont]|uniref:SURF1-like protein n=1 Tax=Solemya velum gill symbiont TaxID=2340 RepID=A0A0B0H9C6_SOVGS|nr:SURF1 family protein [Solemya velum gill symbiont]KHF24061.1 hypothetical protein JV46_24650 [Solemya velum gill symbiont]OOY36177.1 hypothetical protein BOV88_00845 [Solemya velum gill symbiont]OOY38116.1 hypothetical protein BOV89_03235 [Solemya velum gill symbiont]OOY39920.1 hypothetical protein BOV90_06705 [Solemya velum gill symbiont]OOY44674.1 hypothetical protein BOV92_08150 [Solemya velum gill symbiont]